MIDLVILGTAGAVWSILPWSCPGSIRLEIKRVAADKALHQERREHGVAKNNLPMADRSACASNWSESSIDRQVILGCTIVPEPNNVRPRASSSIDPPPPWLRSSSQPRQASCCWGGRGESYAAGEGREGDGQRCGCLMYGGLFIDAISERGRRSVGELNCLQLILERKENTWMHWLSHHLRISFEGDTAAIG